MVIAYNTIMTCKIDNRSQYERQNGFYTARYGLKGCHRAVRTGAATKAVKRTGLEALNNK
jgi:hypothetical protein